MKKTAMMLAILAMSAVAVQAESAAHKNQVTTAKAADASVKLSSDEQAFSAKLNDQNRNDFSEKLSAEQRQAVMAAVKNGANANEAVALLLTAQEVKADAVVADAADVNAEEATK